MAQERCTVEVIHGSVLEEFFQACAALPGFQGVDMGFRWRSGKRFDETRLRLHLRRTLSPANEQLPSRTFKGMAVDIVYADYGAVPATSTSPAASQFLTSGMPCAGKQSGGQISLMVVERRENRLAFLSSWAAVGKGARPGAPIHQRPNPPPGENPIGFLRATKIDRNGLVATCEPSGDRGWLPIVRPGNQSITSLKVPKLGEGLRLGSEHAWVDGIGIYRIRHEVSHGLWKTVDIEGVRLSSRKSVASGALAYDERTSTGAGLVTAVDQSDGPTFMSIACKLPHVFASMGLRLAEYDDLVNVPVQQARKTVVSSPATILGDPRELSETGGTSRPTFCALSANNRPDIATVVWPRLRSVLPERSGGKPRVTERIEWLDPFGAANTTISNIVNCAPEITSLGIRTTKAEDFIGLVTFDQVCERLVDLIDVVS